MTKKNLFSAVLCLLLLFVLIGCGDDTPTPPDEQNGNSNIETFDLQGKTIRIFTNRAADYDYDYSDAYDPTKIRNDDDNHEYWYVVEKVTKSIESRYNCNIEWVDGTTAAVEGTIWNHLKSVYSSGQMYDIVSITGEEFPYMYSNDMVQELKDDMLPDEVKELFWGGKDGFQYNAYTHLGKKWGVGGSNNIFDRLNTQTRDNAFAPILYYNIDLLRSAGIEKMPGEYFEEGTWSWEVFEDMCEQVVANLPGVSGLGDHFYAAGIQNFIGANGSYIFDAYGNIGFYSTAAQEVYSKWNEWYEAKILRNFTYEVNGSSPDTWYTQHWFRDQEVAFTSGRLQYLTGYWKDINYSIVPYPFGPNAASADDPDKIDESKYNLNVYTTGYFWTVPKGKDAAKMYQLLAEFYGGLKEYYTDADDLDKTLENIALEYFDYEDETALKVLKYVQENMNFYIIQSAVPSGIFRQSIREAYNKSSNWYGQMYTYLLSRRAELDPDNPNNFWKSIFGEPGNLAQA